LIKNEFLWGINRVGESSLTIEKQLWTSWQVIWNVILPDGKQFTRQD